ncbi:hypothetical protein [Tardiphaga sp.]|uniref:hypothetical protein n=1 Tax=Tardiphaga sp. TaxID=1926292 RepID=UPI0026205A7D|nr:hypothetical protein [Tardiphaga sp.]MDB5617245.1 hypothetical protein [Tardiphaga sp.]
MIAFVWQALPAFTQIVVDPGRQLPPENRSDVMAGVVMFVMQIAYWYRLSCISVPLFRENPFLSHLFLFVGRLSFVFGSALFSVVLFRHVPELKGEADVVLIVRRGLILFASLFALFCASLEVERVGLAFASRRS